LTTPKNECCLQRIITKFLYLSPKRILKKLPRVVCRTFRMINTLYFTSVGWAVYYIVWKWSLKAPIIAGRKKRSTENLKSQENGFHESPFQLKITNYVRPKFHLIFILSQKLSIQRQSNSAFVHLYSTLLIFVHNLWLKLRHKT
jgi:hypothetical protein